jgi:hypothetical protein
MRVSNTPLLLECDLPKKKNQEPEISPKETLGVSKDHLPGKISISCVKAEWSDYVTLETLQQHEKHCTLKHGSQGRHCLAAIHRFCQATLGGVNYAGTSQEVIEIENPKDGKVYRSILVQCFKPVRKEVVLRDTLKDYDDSCKSHDPSFQVHTDDCYVAANKWCQSVGHSGGITQEPSKEGVIVACYTDVFSNWAYVTPSREFFAAERQVDIVCSLKFDIKEGKIADQAPQFLKMEVYDNSGSSQTLYSSFTVSQQIAEKSIFTQRRMFTISASATASLEASLPYVAKCWREFDSICSPHERNQLDWGELDNRHLY